MTETYSMSFQARLSKVLSENRDGLDLSQLYHGTSLDNLPGVLKHGLDPSQSLSADDELDNDYEFGNGPPYHFVYLARSPRTAEPYAHERKIGRGAMLEIRLPSHLQDKLVLDRGEFIRAPFVIPPQYIRQVS